MESVSHCCLVPQRQGHRCAPTLETPRVFKGTARSASGPFPKPECSPVPGVCNPTCVFMVNCPFCWPGGDGGGRGAAELLLATVSQVEGRGVPSRA